MHLYPQVPDNCVKQVWRVYHVTGNWPWKMVYSSHSSIQITAQPSKWEKMSHRDGWILFLDLCLDHECFSCSVQLLAEWKSGRVTEWRCLSVLSQSQSSLMKRSGYFRFCSQIRPDLAGTDGDSESNNRKCKSAYTFFLVNTHKEYSYGVQISGSVSGPWHLHKPK